MPQKKGVLIEDDMLFEYGYIDAAGIQKFLEHTNSWLKDKKCKRAIAGTKPVEYEEIPFNVFLDDLCKQYNLEPIFFLALIQKEQSAVEKEKEPSKDVQSKIVGYACPEGGGRDMNFAGFETQLSHAVAQFKRYEKWVQVQKYPEVTIELCDSNEMLIKHGYSINTAVASTKAEAMAFLYNPRIEGVTNHSIIFKRYYKICSELGLIEE